jgi:hypothetical protein
LRASTRSSPLAARAPHRLWRGGEGPEERRTGEILREVEPEDLLKFGLIPEFVGRLPVIATLEDLDEDALVEILSEPKNALVKQYARLFEMEDVRLNLPRTRCLRLPRRPSSARPVHVACARSWKASCSTPCSTCRAWKASRKS